MDRCMVCKCNAASRGMVTCAKCRKRKRAWYAATTAAKKESGLCCQGACKNPAKPGCVRCEHHLRINRENAARYIAGLPMRPKAKKKLTPGAVKCATPECSGARTKCHTVCSSCRYQANIRYYREYQRESFRARRAAGLCVHRGCDKPLVPNRRRCAEHLRQYRHYEQRTGANPPASKPAKKRVKKTAIIDRLDNYDAVL